MNKVKKLFGLFVMCTLIFALIIPVSAEVNPRMVFYTVSYNVNGGTGTIRAQSKPEGITIYLATTVPTRTNYIFCGWSTSANSQTAEYYCNDPYSTNESVTLYAVWKEFPYISGSSTYDETFSYPYYGGTSETDKSAFSQECDAYARYVYYTVNNYYAPSPHVLNDQFEDVTLTTSNLKGYLDMFGAGAYVRGTTSSGSPHSVYIETYTSSTVTIRHSNWTYGGLYEHNTVWYETFSYLDFLTRITTVTSYYSRI